MTNNINTMELARIYESQGYFKDALKMYQNIQSSSPGIEIKAGINRMTAKLNQKTDSPQKPSMEDITDLISSVQDDDTTTENQPVSARISGIHHLSSELEKWISLVLIENQINDLKKLKNI